MQHTKNKIISIIVPIFNEESNIQRLYQELCLILKKLTLFKNYEIILVDDGSNDNSFKMMKDLAQNDNNIKVISFTRNFGHEHAITAGLKYCKGNAAVIIDADLQDPPELILDFEKEYNNNYHIIYGQRTKRLNESIIKKLTSKLFYPLFNFITKIDMPHDVGDFCMISRRVIDIIKQMPEQPSFVRALIYWTGLSKKAVPFIRKQRTHGKTKYNYWNLTVQAIDHIASFSKKPATLIVSLFLSATFFCFINLLVSLFIKNSILLSIISTCLFLITLLFLSTLGIYIVKIFQETTGRPPFLVNKFINFKENK